MKAGGGMQRMDSHRTSNAQLGAEGSNDSGAQVILDTVRLLAESMICPDVQELT